MGDSSSQLLLESDQMWVLLIGTIVPLGGYLLNKYLPWKSETVKGIAQVLLMAIAGTLYTALATDIGGFTGFVQQAFSATVAGLFAHNILWKPSNVNVKFGAVPTPTQAAGMSDAEIKALDADQVYGIAYAAESVFGGQQEG